MVMADAPRSSASCAVAMARWRSSCWGMALATLEPPRRGMFIQSARTSRAGVWRPLSSSPRRMAWPRLSRIASAPPSTTCPTMRRSSATLGVKSLIQP